MYVKGKLVLLFRNDLCVHNFNVSLLGHATLKKKKVLIERVEKSTLEKAMATHSSTLAWKIPWTEEPSGLPSMGPHRVGHD